MFAWLLLAGPGWFVLGELVWCAIIVGIVILLPGIVGLVTAVAVSVGHTFGALSWLIVGVSTVALYPVFALFALAPIAQTWIYLRPRLSVGNPGRRT